MSSEQESVALSLIIIAAALYISQRHPPRTIYGANGNAAQPALDTSQSSEPFHLSRRSKTIDCHTHDGLPDSSCTPGSIFPNATAEEICITGYTKTVRNVSVDLKRQVYSAYGLSYPQPRGDYEVDHFIPLELGGSNDIANLFPEAAEPVPGFHEKDLVENYLHQQVCAGAMDLIAAQRAMSTNWITVYNSLTPDQLQALRVQFQ